MLSNRDEPKVICPYVGTRHQHLEYGSRKRFHWCRYSSKEHLLFHHNQHWSCGWDQFPCQNGNMLWRLWIESFIAMWKFSMTTYTTPMHYKIMYNKPVNLDEHAYCAQSIQVVYRLHGHPHRKIQHYTLCPICGSGKLLYVLHLVESLQPAWYFPHCKLCLARLVHVNNTELKYIKLVATDASSAHTSMQVGTYVWHMPHQHLHHGHLDRNHKFQFLDWLP